MTPHECPDDELCVACLAQELAACFAELRATDSDDRRAELAGRIEMLSDLLELECED
jgi:hypothetical protein